MGTKATCACSDCGHEQDSLDRRCDRCDGPRVVLISVLEDLFGPRWREGFVRPEGEHDSSCPTHIDHALRCTCEEAP